MNVDGKTECKLVKLIPNGVQLTLSNVDYRFVNTLRHILLEEIPCLAFHSFHFDYNRTVLEHEHIMQILRMIPLASEAIQELRWTSHCDCENKCCEACSVQFEINVSNDGTGYRSITTQDIVATHRNVHLKHSVHVTAKQMEILVLAPGHALKLTAHAQIGIGREHGKWVCIPTMIFQGIPLLEASPFHVLSTQQQAHIVNGCPKKVFAMRHNLLDIEDILACSACDECTIALHKVTHTTNPSIELSDSDFLLTIETDGRHNISFVLTLLFQIMRNKIPTLSH